jgi:hypothetical protein
MSEITNFRNAFESQEQSQPMFAKNTFYQVIQDVNAQSYSHNTQIQFDSGLLKSAPEWPSFNESSIQIPMQVTAKIGGVAQGFKNDDVTKKLLKSLVVLKGDNSILIDACNINLNSQQITNLESHHNLGCSYKLQSTMSSDYEEVGALDHDFVLHRGTPGYTDGFGETLDDPNFFEKKAELITSELDMAGFKSLAQIEAGKQSYFIPNTGDKAAASSRLLTWNYIIDIPLKNVHELFEKMGMVHGTHIKLNLQINNANFDFKVKTASADPVTFIGATAVVGSITGTTENDVISDMNVQTPYGTNPWILNHDLITKDRTSPGFAGLFLEKNVEATIQVRSNIGKTSDSVSKNPLLHSCQLRFKMYTPRPEYDKKLLLRQKLKIDFNTFTTKQIQNVTPGGQLDVVVTSSASRAKYLLIHTRHSDAVNGSPTPSETNPSNNANRINSMESPFSACPVTSKPHFSWENFQVQLGTLQLFTPTVLSDTKVFYEDNFRGMNSLLGGQNMQMSSGLVSRPLYEKLYGGLIVIDLERFTNTNEFLSIKDLRVTGKSSSLSSVDVILQLFTQNDLELDVDTGNIV